MIPKLVALLAAAVLASIALADDDDQSTRAGATFKSLDRDSDQQLSASEASEDEALAQHFAALDTDADGFLNEREYAAHVKGHKRKDKRRDY